MNIDRKYNFLVFAKRVWLVHHQQNKCYTQRCLIAYFEATLDLSRSEFTCP